MKQRITLGTLLLIGALPCVALAAGSEAPAASTRSESAGEYIDDAAITTKVKARLVEDKTVKASDIKVKTDHGTVQLSGVVDSRSQIDRAVQLAGDVAGVKSVRNEIRLK